MRRVIVNSTPLIALYNADLVIIDDNAAKKRQNIIKLALKQVGEL